MKQLYTIILICILALVQLNAQNPDSLKQALVKSKSLFSGYQTQTYYPESDCVGAIPICTDTFISTTIYNGRGYYQEINYLNSCLGVGEYRGAWYKIYITQPGLLGFNIIPADTSDDYDWSLFNLTYASCSDIFTIDTLQISCSFAGYNGITGANSDTTINIGNNNPKVNVLANETYYLYISFFNDESHGSNDTSFTYQSGYTIDFSISSCAIDSCLQQIITNIPEDKSNILAELYPNPAGNSFTIRLDALKAGQGYNMQLFTSTGALVRDIVNIKESENIVDVSNLATGLYYYRILTTDGKTAAGRFVKE